MLSTVNALRTLLQCLFVMLAGTAVAQETVFGIDRLNTGLVGAPDQIDRSSPQATMEALLDLAEIGDFANAAHLLNLASIPSDKQAFRGPDLAEKLYSVIDRKVVITWADLLDRPDALDANATNKSAVAGQARRSILLWVLTINDRPYPIRLDRVQVGDASPIWVFSERSVANIEKLYAAFGPSDMEQSLPNWARGDAFWNLKWWEVIGLPIMLLLSVLGGFLVHKGFTLSARKANRRFVTRIVEAARLPSVVLTMTSILAAISGVFIFSGPVSTLIAPTIALGFVMSALILVVNVVDRIIDQLIELDDEDLKQMGQNDSREMATKVSLARRMLIVVIVLVGFGIVLAEADVARTFGFSLLASAGAMTLLLGFAAREVLSNIMSSMQIALNQSARIGDKLVYNGQICNVERINFTYVLLRVWTGVRLVVPVNEFVSETFENWTMKEPQMKRLIEIRVAHTAEVSKLRDLFFEVLEEVDQDEIGNYDDHEVLVTSHDVFGQEITFSLSCANPNTSWTLSCEVRERLVEQMQKIERSGTDVFPNINSTEGA